MIQNKKSLLGRKVIVFGAGASMLAALTTGCGDSLSSTQKSALVDIKTSPARIAEILGKIGKGVALDLDEPLRKIDKRMDTPVKASEWIVNEVFRDISRLFGTLERTSDKVSGLGKVTTAIAKGGEIEKLAKANIPASIDAHGNDKLGEINKVIATVGFIAKHQTEIYEKAESGEVKKVDEAIKYLKDLNGEFKTIKWKEGATGTRKLVEEPGASTIDIKAYSAEVLKLLEELKGIIENVADVENKLEGKGSKGSTPEEKDKK